MANNPSSSNAMAFILSLQLDAKCFEGKCRKEFSVGAVESGAEGLYGRWQLHLGVTQAATRFALFTLHSFALCAALHCFSLSRKSAI